MFCSKCGSSNADDVKLCIQCGADLTPQSSTPPINTISGSKTLIDKTPVQSPTPYSGTLSGGRTLTPGTPGMNLDANAAMGDFDLHTGDVVAGRFEVLAVIGEGGMGKVYKVRDSKLNQLRAMKIIHPHLLQRPDVLERFRQEVRTCQTLAHPSIVRVYEYEEDESRNLHLFTMEYVDGMTLRKWFDFKKKQNSEITIDEFRKISKQICQALDHAHRVKIIHRDLKPENILLDNATGNAKLTDFGISKALSGPSSNVTVGMIGTPYYAAPEQERSEEVDARADVYAAGVMFYEILTGQIPRAGCKPVFELRPEAGKELSDAVAKAMSASREDRFKSVADFYLAIKRSGAVPNEPDTITTLPEESQGRLSRGFSLWKGLFIVAACVAVFMLALYATKYFSSRPTTIKLQESAKQIGEAQGVRTKDMRSQASAISNEKRTEDTPAGKAGPSAKKSQRKTDMLAVKPPVQSIQQNTMTLDCGDNIKMELVQIPAGEFLMGSLDSEPQHGSDECPQFKVTISKPFFMGKYEVTQAQWQAVMGSNPSHYKGKGNLPVENISWNNCQEFCKKLSQKTGQMIQLPTEAQWEYACRAGTKTRYYYGDVNRDLSVHAWYADNSGSITHPVGLKTANAFGLYDMYGNVWEWCQDWYDNYPTESQVDPTGVLSGSDRVLRGGAWSRDRESCRSATRSKNNPSYGSIIYGMRVACVAGGSANDSRPRVSTAIDDNKTTVDGKTERVVNKTPIQPDTLKTKMLDCGNGAKMELVQIPAGEFLMGSTDSDVQHGSDEGPQHPVTISKPFYMGKCEVTQTQWQAVMGRNPSYFKGEGNLPVEQVSWNDCQEFCKKLSQTSGMTVRLPTEAEWEYACRAGTTTRYCCGNTDSDLRTYAWYDVNSGSKTYTTGEKKANPFGLHDMHGNVYEWCQDRYGSYSSDSQIDPAGSPSGDLRVMRGGAWNFKSRSCRSASRNWAMPTGRIGFYGLRVVCADDGSVETK